MRPPAYFQYPNRAYTVVSHFQLLLYDVLDLLGRIHPQSCGSDGN
jgi:hypothetical protein